MPAFAGIFLRHLAYNAASSRSNSDCNLFVLARRSISGRWRICGQIVFQLVHQPISLDHETIAIHTCLLCHTRNENLTSRSSGQATGRPYSHEVTDLIDHAAGAWRGLRIWHGLLGREGGVSRGPFASLNFSYLAGDDPAAVQTNWRRLHACFPPGVEFVQVHQVHRNQVHVVDTAQPRNHRGGGRHGNRRSEHDSGDPDGGLRPDFAVRCGRRSGRRPARGMARRDRRYRIRRHQRDGVDRRPARADSGRPWSRNRGMLLRGGYRAGPAL